MRSIPEILAFADPSLNLRFARSVDASGILEIYSPLIRDTAITFEISPPTLSEMEVRMRGIQEKYPWLIFEADGEIAGYAYACEHRARAAYRWAAEVSVYVHPRHQAKGIGKKLYGALFEILRMQGYQYLLAGITLPNAPSVRLHEAVGMKPLGVYHGIGFKLGKWHDVGWWEYRLQATTNLHPAEPRPLKAFLSD